MAAPSPRPQRELAAARPLRYLAGMTEALDVVIVGAGPAGLAAAIEAARRSLQYLVIDQGAVVDSLLHYPTDMVFFTTKERLEIGGVPFPLARAHPSRTDALAYYRQIVQSFALNVRTFEKLTALHGQDGAFHVSTEESSGVGRAYQARKIVLALGYFSHPNLLGIPGEELPKVSHYYTEGHAYHRRDVAVIGGRNSAAEAALDLHRHGARVTLIHRRAAIAPSVKYWIAPDLGNRIAEGGIRALFETRVLEIRATELVVETAGEPACTLANDFVFALTGYRPDVVLLDQLAIAYDAATLKPIVDEHFETRRPGIYAIGSMLAGAQSGEVFIENGRFHGQVAIEAIALRR
ncbi:MAG: YpdA family putative bacillithiol disulfide reductase [Planctomycetota bacterium]